MKILFDSIATIVDRKLTLAERGVLITLLLMKEKDPKMLLAKFKVSVNWRDATDHLLALHEKGLIDWSGYQAMKKKVAEDRLTPELIDIVDFMNGLLGSKFNPKTKSVYQGILARLEDYSADQLKLVVSNRYQIWKDDPKMQQYLTPSTLFRPSKFEKYIVEAERTQIGAGAVAAERFDLKSGDQITEQNCDQLIDQDIYALRQYNVESGQIKKLGSRTLSLLGRDIKRNIKLQQNAIKRGETPNFAYIFTSNG